MTIPADVVERANDLLALCDSDDPAKVSEAFYGALNLLLVVHGPGSVQKQQLIQTMTVADRSKDGIRSRNLQNIVAPAVEGALKALKADVEAGLTGNVAMQASGELLGDFLGLAREALDGPAIDARKNVAAVLVAAAFEDTLRRLAAAKASVADRPSLEEIVGRLKAAGVLVGASVSTANGYLKFRNDSLHADWQNVQVATISSCMAFVEGLLHEHFS